MNSSSGKNKVNPKKPILYGTMGSPPCRAVYCTAKALNIELETKETQTVNGDQYSSDFVKVYSNQVLFN